MHYSTAAQNPSALRQTQQEKIADVQEHLAGCEALCREEHLVDKVQFGPDVPPEYGTNL